MDTSTLKVDSTLNRVGIGTASPTGIFHAANLGTAGTTADNFNGYFSSANRNSNVYILAKNTEGSNLYLGDGDSNTVGAVIYDHTSNYMRFDVNGSEAMRLNSTGLGVGASPITKFQISGGSSAVYQTFTNTSGAYQHAYVGNPSNALTFGFSSQNGSFSADEKMRIDTSGNVGVGVTPSAWTIKAVQVVNGSIYGAGNETGFYGNAFYGSSGWTYIAAAGASGYLQNAGTHQWFTAASGAANAAITDFATAKMTLDASGNLLVGKTASSTTVAGSQVQPDGTHSAVKSDGNPGFFYNTTTAISGTISLFRSNGVTVGSISQDGTNTAYNNSSDYRLKESVQPLTGGLDRVNALKPSIYKWKTNGKVGEGFLAHELAEVVPFAVTGEKDAVTKDGEIEPQQVDLSKVVPILVAAIKELTARVEALEA